MSTPQLTQAQCLTVVHQWLLTHDWQLATPAGLTNMIWSEPVPLKDIQDGIWQQYGVILHNACCDPAGDTYQRAWHELAQWLQKQVTKLPGTPQDRQDIAQETLIKLQQYLNQHPLNIPRTLWAFALQTARRQAIDLNRQRKAIKRGAEEEELSLEELETNDEDWQEHRTTDNTPYQLETTVSEDLNRQELVRFFQQYLATPLQTQVAIMHFLDNLEPAEIAKALNKKPQEIRMVKARIVEALRQLPPEAKQHLMTLLDTLD